jgi:hypothetical protein
MTYQLQNGCAVDEEALCKAMDTPEDGISFFNMKTGQVALLPHGDTLACKAFTQNPVYRQIPIVPPEKKIEWMKEFIPTLFASEDAALRLKLAAVLKENGGVIDTYIRCCAIIKSDAGWDQWLADHLWEEMGGFLFGVNPMIKDVWEFDDDCAVCDAMHLAEEKGKVLSEHELRAAFAVGNMFSDERICKPK